VEEYALLNDRQQSQAEETAELAVKFGMFDQSSGADGAHYAPAAKNPFKADGLMCKNCVFFNEEEAQCQVVAGPIEPEAICKMWIIPESSIAASAREDEPPVSKEQLKALLMDNSANGRAERQAKIDKIMQELND
jgi:hypothetical protein